MREVGELRQGVVGMSTLVNRMNGDSPISKTHAIIHTTAFRQLEERSIFAVKGWRSDDEKIEPILDVLFKAAQDGDRDAFNELVKMAKKLGYPDDEIANANWYYFRVMINGGKKELFSDIKSDPINLLGIPWGIVRYTWKGCKWADYHLVWQKDDTIYRMPCPLVSKVDYKDGLLTTGELFARDVFHKYENFNDVLTYEKLRKKTKIALGLILLHLQVFEQLDQLFIAV
jgi:hypothetical protein